MKIDITAKPFNLDSDGVKWTENTLAAMSTEDKIKQLFCAMARGFNRDELLRIIKTQKAGGLMFRPGSKVEISEASQFIRQNTAIPLLIAANTEAGANGLVFEGTSFGSPMSVAAASLQDASGDYAYKLGKVVGQEGQAVGLNWAFAPIIDIDYNYRNPITNTRTFGSNPDTVIACAGGYLRGAKEHNVAVSIKHFPGDGVDERDQHIVTAINSLSAEKWYETYGRVYQALIEQGAQTVMAGHIAQPAVAADINPKADTCLPGSLSKELLTGVLRKKFRFNGVITTDASPMLGFTTAMKRRDAVPCAIAAGCDMILFCKSAEEDFHFMLEGMKNGVITPERLDEAVTRILALKASLKLHSTKAQPDLSIIGSAEHQAWAKEVADKSITLVRDTQHLLPLSPGKYKRVTLNVIQHDKSPANPLALKIKALFEKAGFSVTLRDRSVKLDIQDFFASEMPAEKMRLLTEMAQSTEEFAKSMDLYVYVANIEPSSNKTTARLDWEVLFGMGNDAPWFTAEVPTLFISTGVPYHLYDVPSAKTYINTYSSSDAVLDALMEKLAGHSKFTGVSPVDPFCGGAVV